MYSDYMHSLFKHYLRKPSFYRRGHEIVFDSKPVACALHKVHHKGSHLAISAVLM